jgi:hypothetical protein
MPSSNSSVNLTNATMGSLMTDQSSVYSDFINWYNLFFGANGLVATNKTQVMDGNTTVLEYEANVTSI